MQTTVRIPVLPSVRLYLIYHYGERLIVSERDYPATLIRNMLEKHCKTDPSQVRPSQKIELGATIDIFIGKREFSSLGAYICNDNIRLFSELINEQIRQEMYRFVNHPNRQDDVVDYNIRRFQDLYGFDEDDLSFDTLKRWYYRERERIKKRQAKAQNFTSELFLNYSSFAV